ncbi:MAG: transglutaminase domain-containing protein [DPANN group archaeon]|nr:transglutaminase domain-containing protein [DPANN group archaeon]
MEQGREETYPTDAHQEMADAEGKLEDAPQKVRTLRRFYQGIAVLLVLLMIFWIIPAYTIKIDPEPRQIPTVQEARPGNFSLSPIKVSFPTPDQFYEFVHPEDPVVKQTADYVISRACEGREGRICNAKALFYFVRDKFAYTNDPLSYEYVKTPRESLRSPVGDCDDASVLLASLLRAEGIDTRFVFIPGHVYVKAYLPDARRKYHDGDFWVALDATCEYCGFGEIPYKNQDAKKKLI